MPSRKKKKENNRNSLWESMTRGGQKWKYKIKLETFCVILKKFCFHWMFQESHFQCATAPLLIKLIRAWRWNVCLVTTVDCHRNSFSRFIMVISIFFRAYDRCTTYRRRTNRYSHFPALKHRWTLVFTLRYMLSTLRDEVRRLFSAKWRLATLKNVRVSYIMRLS